MSELQPLPPYVGLCSYALPISPEEGYEDAHAFLLVIDRRCPDDHEPGLRPPKSVEWTFFCVAIWGLLETTEWDRSHGLARAQGERGWEYAWGGRKEGRDLLRDDPALVARWLIREHKTARPNDWHHDAAAAALARLGIESDDARNELAEALRRECTRIDARPGTSLEALNEAVVEALERISGKAQALSRQEVAADPLFWWATPTAERDGPEPRYLEVRFARALAAELYEAQQREAAHKAQRIARNPSAGVESGSLTNLIRIGRAARASGGIQGRIDGHGWTIADEHGKAVGRLASPEISPEIMAALRSLHLQRVLRWAVWESYAQRFEHGNEAFHELHVEGGLEELAARIGASGQKAHTQIRDALEALSLLRIDAPRSEGQVLAWHHYKAKGQQRSWLQIVLMGPLRPDYLDDDDLPRERRKLVPVPLPQMLPPFIGRPNEQAAEASLQLLVMREFRQHARSLVKHGFIELADGQFRRLADEAGVPRALVGRIFDAYQTGNDDARPVLTRAGGGFDLAEAYGPQRASIISVGEAVMRGGKSRQQARDRAKK